MSDDRQSTVQTIKISTIAENSYMLVRKFKEKLKKVKEIQFIRGHVGTDEHQRKIYIYTYIIRLGLIGMLL